MNMQTGVLSMGQLSRFVLEQISFTTAFGLKI